MPLTEQDARALTYLAKRLRDETHGANRWDEAGTYAVIAKLIGHNLAVTIERVTRHAADAQAKTPGAIMRPYTPEAPKGEPFRPPKRGEDCPRHPGQWAHSCGGCVADRNGIGYDDEKPADPPPPRPRPAKTTTRDAALAECRAAIREEKA